MRVCAAKYGWKFVLDEFGINIEIPEGYGCDAFNIELVEQKEKIAKLRRFFKEFTVEVVRDVGTNKWMVRAEILFDEDCERICANKK